MLGHKVWQVCRSRFDTWGTLRRSPRNYGHAAAVFDPDRIVVGVDAGDLLALVQTIARVRPTVVVNCIGIVKQLAAAKDPVSSLRINSLFPHELGSVCHAAGARLIHISTDCVFSGTRGGYVEGDAPDATDLYGRTKLLGEVGEPHLTLRTSIIGRELSGQSGLVEWFLSQGNGPVRGFRKAIFSGLTTLELARAIAMLIERHPGLSGLYHVSAQPIDKYSVLEICRDAWRLSCAIEPDDRLVIDRSLNSERFTAATGIRVPDWPDMIAGMVADADHYAEWRS
jgi:dTDP-4-dehydrorhamnose reductase